MQCARHPNVETELRCGRCDTPICPRCAVFTDVGARCPTCAPRRKLPQFEIGPAHLLRAATAGIGGGAALGAIWGLILPGRILIFTILVAAGIGYLVAEAVSRATNRKAGPVLQGIAIAGVIVAYLVRNVVIGDEVVPGDDFFGYVAVVIAGIVAMSRLRF